MQITRIILRNQDRHFVTIYVFIRQHLKIYASLTFLFQIILFGGEINPYKAELLFI